MKIRALSPFFLWLYLFIIITLVSCNNNPVVTKIQTQNNLLSQVIINPRNIQLSGVTNSADTSITVHITAVVTDTSGLIGNLHYLIKNVLLNQSAGGGMLSSYDPSTKSYSGSFVLQLGSTDNGEFQVTVYGIQKNGQMTNSYIGLVKVIGQQGKPPQIIYATNPDTVKIPSSGSLNVDFEAKVADPDGQNNIDYVKLDLQRDGTTSYSTYQLYDDGGANGSNSGDAVAGDSVFTRRFRIDSSNTPGSFTIRYYSFDKNGLGSDTVTTHLVISK